MQYDRENASSTDVRSISGTSSISGVAKFACLTLLAVGSHAWAQEGDGGASSSEPDAQASETAAAAPKNRLVEEVVVTAQKREENLQDVPISVSALSADMLDARGITDPKDLPLATPGLTITNAAGFSLTYLRGVGTDAFFMTDPSVALYIDGIYFPFSHGAAQSFGAIERIEVLKGPQGTLFGRNAVGGAINVIAKAPDFRSSEVEVQTSFSSYEKSENRVHVNIPLADNLAVSVSGQYNTEDSYYNGTVGGQPLPKEITRGGRFKIRWAPTEDVDLQLSGFRLEQSGLGTMISTNPEPSLITRIATGQILGLYDPPQGANAVNDAPSYLNVDSKVVYGQATWNTSVFDVKVLGAHEDMLTGALYDFDGTGVPIASFTVPAQFSKVKTGELQILSNQDSWGAEHFNWIIGAYYFTGEQGNNPSRFAVAGSVVDKLQQLVTGPTIFGQIGNFLGLTIIDNSHDGILDATGIAKTDSQSIFGQTTVHITDWFAVTAGARLQEEKRKILKSQGAVVLPLGEPAVIPYYSSPQLSDTTKTFKPKLSLDFRPWEGTLLYLSYQQASKSSAYNVINFLPVNTIGNQLLPTLVKPEEMTAYETGIKTTLFDGTTRFNASAFWYDITDIQVQFISLLAGGAVTFENAPKARIRGFDFDVVSQLFPSVFDNLVFTFGGAYVDSEYTKFPSGQGFDETTGIYRSNLDLTGGQMARAPKFTGTVALVDTIPMAGGPLELAVDYSYNSGFYYIAQNNPTFHEDAYGVLGARASYLYEPWNTRVTVFGRNLLDKEYRYGMLCTDFGPLSNWAPPRAIGVRLNWEF